jgi:ATP-dependent helicase/nuclease subunit A
MPVWTSEQLEAIRRTDGSLLVSAAAGSGKTSVLAARCVHLVCDAPSPCNVDQLLVVTFTREAANEMRTRIQRALQERIGDRDDPRLRLQLLLLPRAQVNTLHGFCSGLVRQHFNRLGIDPGTRLLDENETTLLRLERARQTVADAFEQDADGGFSRLVSAYGNGDDARIVALVLRLDSIFASLVDPEQWKQRTIARIDEATSRPLRESELGRAYLDDVRAALQDLVDEAAQVMALIGRYPETAKYGKAVGTIAADLQQFMELFSRGGPDALADAMHGYQPPNLPPIRGEVAGKELVKDRIDALREQVKAFNGRVGKFREAELREGMRHVLEPVRTLLAVADEFTRRFTAAKRELRAMDFNDLERFTLRLLRDDAGGPTDLARQCHAQFRHVLVDEYQDINELQDELLRLLSRECAAGIREANLFCVGDVKQSIYGFRLADPTRFLARLARLDDGTLRQVVHLQRNFRSRAPLLQCVNAVFERLMSRQTADLDYDRTQRLNPGLEYPAGAAAAFRGAPIELCLLPDKLQGDATPSAGEDAGGDERSGDAEPGSDFDRTEREAAYIADRIRSLTGQDGSPPRMVMQRNERGELTPRPVRLGDIAILLRSTRYKARQFAEQLHAAGVSVFSDTRSGFFDALEVRDVMSLLELLANQKQDLPLAAVLRSPLMGIDDPDTLLARVRVAYPPGESGVPFHVAARRYATSQSDASARVLSGCFARIDRWRTLAYARPVSELLDAVLEETGYLAFVAGLVNGEQRVANLRALHDRARQFGAFQRQSLPRFIEFMQTLRDESDLGQPSIATAAQDAVRVMSVHESKGLEFPIVFLADVGKNHNEQDLQQPILIDRDHGLAATVVEEDRRIRYPSLATQVVERRLRRAMLAEEMRILYVAMTRAREHLICVGTVRSKTIDAARQRWEGVDGPLPPARVLAARSYLDWLLPVAFAAGPAVIERIRLDPEQLQQTLQRARGATRAADHVGHYAALRPLDGEIRDPDADALLAEIARPYAHQAFVDLPAATSVTALTKHGRASLGARDRSLGLVRFQSLLELPRSITPAVVSPTERGSATHLALQHLEFSLLRGRGSLVGQLDLLEQRKILSPEQARMVDVDAIEWLVTSDLGRLLAANPSRLLRELPVYFADDADDGDLEPMDRVMVRGRVDAMLALDDGLVLIDYKTDSVDASTLDERAAFYGPQLRAYRDAIERATSRRVVGTYLVFLTPRALVEVPPNT